MEFVATKRVLVYHKLFLLVTLVVVVIKQVFGFYPFTHPNYMMVGRVMKTFFQVDRLRCLHECHVNEQCLSYNFEPSTEGKGLCELNRCRVKDSHEREKSFVYRQGVFLHQIRSSKSVDKVILCHSTVSSLNILCMTMDKYNLIKSALETYFQAFFLLFLPFQKGISHIRRQHSRPIDKQVILILFLMKLNLETRKFKRF